MFFYSDTGANQPFKGDVWNMNACTAYMKHFNNKMFLLLLQNEGTPTEKVQATKELDICNRKLKFWERHPNFDYGVVRMEKESVIKVWKGRLSNIVPIAQR